MDKKITAIYTSSEKAAAAALSLSESNRCKDISIGSGASANIYLPDFSLKWTFLGAAIGAAAGIFVSSMAETELFFSIAPLSGLITGSVIGGISGGFAEIISDEHNNEYNYISLSAPQKNLFSILKQLRKRGAVNISIKPSGD